VSHHGPKQLTDTDKTPLGAKAWPAIRNLFIVGLVTIILALIYCFATGQGADRFGYAYLVGFAFALAITLGSLFFVVITTLFRAGWCTVFRRVPETLAANMPTLVILFVPIMIFVIVGNGKLYPWASTEMHDYIGHHYGDTDGHANIDTTNPHLAFLADTDETPHGEGEHGTTLGLTDAPAPAPSHNQADHATHPADADHGDTHSAAGDHGEGHDAHGSDHAWTHTADAWEEHSHAVPYFVHKKGPWYTTPFFALRWVVYFLIWISIGAFYWRNSVKQDATGNLEHTHKREWWAPLSVAAFALTVTAASFDLLMSLDPVWFSTMFGVYFFADCFTCGICAIILILMFGQKHGQFTAVTTEHYHDLGKLLFAFVFFWGYVGYSQFMLIWYASMPETTYWWEIRGATTVADAPTYGGPWAYVSYGLLFGHFLLPFAALLSKHVKRQRRLLMIVAIWMLAICFVDFFWIALPTLVSPEFVLPIPEALCAIGCVAIMLARALSLASKHSLTPHNDPRLHESLALDTTAWAPLYPPPASMKENAGP